MKANKYRLSLFLALLLLLAGIICGAVIYLQAGSYILPPFDGYIAQAILCASFAPDMPGALSIALAFVLESISMLCLRRRKRASMYMSFIMIPFMYVTLLAYFHILGGIERPEWLMMNITGEKPWLVLVCLALELILYIALLSMLRPLDKRIYSRHEFRIRQMQKEGLIPTEEEEAEAKEAERIEKRSKKEAERDEKDALRYRKAKERLDRKMARKAEKEARRDEKQYRKAMEKQEAAEAKEADKARRKAEKAEAKAAKETAEAEPGDEFFTTSGISSSHRAHDPSDPLQFPDIASIPDLSTIAPDGPEEDYTATAIDESDEPVRMMDSDVFSQVKGELEREAEGRKEEEERRKFSDFSEPISFQKGSMLEATLENLMPKTPAAPIKQGPIIGFDDKKKEKEEKPSAPSIAPSGLSPDHPRYKLFAALSNKPNVSHFPSKGFVPEDKSEDIPSYGSTFVSEKKPASLKEEPADTAASRPSPAPSPEPSRVPARKPDPKPQAEEEEDEVFSSAIDVFEAPMDSGMKKIAPKDPFSEEPKPRKATKPAAESVEEADAEASDEEARQANELLLSVGIGGLQSNELGFAAISKRSKKRYSAPSSDFLVDYPEISTEIDDFTRSQGEVIVDTLRQFNTEVTLDNIVKGPTVTMYEIKLKEGTPVSRVRSRYDELSYNLGGVQIRILAPVPGHQAVGIEVPNKKRATIGFKDMLKAMKRDSDAAKLRVPMILGRTITGKPVVIDVAKMPHMLIAGTTGSGKSVCINTFICTILYTRAPQDVRFIMIDPKVVELSVYNGIPHLLTPVITEAKKVVRALAWLVDEMERRYQVLSRFGVRNIDGLNAKIRSENLPVERMPYIVLIMDEFADLMTTVGKDIENYVARLAAKARAAGIHLVLATQRPSSDVITGTIKNNFPARIAFTVSSSMNSRIILDEGGAEALLGRGDMLFMNPGAIGFERIQGAFLSDEEVDAVVSFEKRNSTPDYLCEDIFEEPAPEPSDDEGEEDYSDEDSDEVLYERAKEIVFERKMASASYLQRRMRIGYNRAARLIEMMEDDGIIGPANGSKPREILRYE